MCEKNPGICEENPRKCEKNPGTCERIPDGRLDGFFVACIPVFLPKSFT